MTNKSKVVIPAKAGIALAFSFQAALQKIGTKEAVEKVGSRVEIAIRTGIEPGMSGFVG